MIADPVPREGYRVGVPEGGCWVEILNTDASLYGGSNCGNAGGLETKEIAHVLGVSKRTVDSDWAVARMWLSRELGSAGSS